MGGLKYEIKEDATKNSIQLFLSGSLDEHAILPEIKASPHLIINLNGVKHLNSVGTRTWYTWIKKVSQSTEITLEECPMLFVNAFNFISGFLPKNATVNSFTVPFISQDSEESKLVLFKRGEHYDGQGKVSYQVVVDSKGKPMELDVLKNYFTFLRKV